MRRAVLFWFVRVTNAVSPDTVVLTALLALACWGRA